MVLQLSSPLALYEKGKGDTEHVPKASAGQGYSLGALLSYCNSELSNHKLLKL